MSWESFSLDRWSTDEHQFIELARLRYLRTLKREYLLPLLCTTIDRPKIVPGPWDMDMLKEFEKHWREGRVLGDLLGSLGEQIFLEQLLLKKTEGSVAATESKVILSQPGGHGHDTVERADEIEVKSCGVRGLDESGTPQSGFINMLSADAGSIRGLGG